MIILDDLIIKDNFYPFSQIRSVIDIRVGILTIREKCRLITGLAVTALSEIKEETLSSETIPANKIPSLPDRLLKDPWDIIAHNADAIRSDFNFITHLRSSYPISETNKVISPNNLFLEEGVKMEHCIINASQGPVYIGKGADIMEGTMIRGPVAICEGAVVKMGTRLYSGTTIGPYCMAGGEIKNSILMGYSNKAHDGYLGDSIIGEWCNLGAGTSNSNLKNSAGEIKAWDNKTKQYRAVGSKAGLLMGDFSRCAINTSFNTGTVAGICCNIFAPGLQPKYIPDFSWGNERYELGKLYKDIDNWKKLKSQHITDTDKQILKNLYSTYYA